jgi:hypothetical protein
MHMGRYAAHCLTRGRLSPITSVIITDIMICPIIRALPHTVSLARSVVRFVIRLMVSAIIRTIASATTLARARMPTAIATVTAAAA